MKKSFFSEYPLYATAKGLSFFLRVLPLRLALGFGAACGVGMYRLLPKRAALARGNLHAAFSKELSLKELEVICRNVFKHLGMLLVEVLRTPSVDKAYLDKWVKIEGLEHIERAVAQGKGAVLLTGHFGNWELTSLTAGLRGYPILVLARMQGLPKLNNLLNQYRESKGCQVISKGMAVRTMVRALRSGKMVGILADQDAGRRGILAPFFGRLASTAGGAIRMALEQGCPVLPAFITREDGPRHTLVVNPPLKLEYPSPEESQNLDQADPKLQKGVGDYMNLLEQFVRRAPEQWLWPHRRWKSSPHKGILVLTDEKAGHQTQAVAAAGLLTRTLEERLSLDTRLSGSSGPWVQQTVTQIHYRSEFRRKLLSLLMALKLTSFMPGWWWVRWALTEESFKTLEQSWANWVVSSGAQTALINLLWSKSFSAKSVHVMTPPKPFSKAFHLRIVPKHDGHLEDDQTIVTQGALHAVGAEEGMPDWLKTVSLKRPHRIGALIGGDSAGVKLSFDQVETVLGQLLQTAEKLDADLLVTTSRRTPATIEAFVRERLNNHPYCPLLVLAGSDQRAGVVPAILAQSDAVVVSGDSISMLSEAASIGKPVVVFEAHYEKHPSKHQQLVQSLANQGHLRVAAPMQVSEQLLGALQKKDEVLPLDDASHVMERLRGWV